MPLTRRSSRLSRQPSEGGGTASSAKKRVARRSTRLARKAESGGADDVSISSFSDASLAAVSKRYPTASSPWKKQEDEDAEIYKIDTCFEHPRHDGLSHDHHDIHRTPAKQRGQAGRINILRSAAKSRARSGVKRTTPRPTRVNPLRRDDPDEDDVVSFKSESESEEDDTPERQDVLVSDAEDAEHFSGASDGEVDNDEDVPQAEQDGEARGNPCQSLWRRLCGQKPDYAGEDEEQDEEEAPRPVKTADPAGEQREESGGESVHDNQPSAEHAEADPEEEDEGVAEEHEAENIAVADRSVEGGDASEEVADRSSGSESAARKVRDAGNDPIRACWSRLCGRRPADDSSDAESASQPRGRPAVVNNAGRPAAVNNASEDVDVEDEEDVDDADDTSEVYAANDPVRDCWRRLCSFSKPSDRDEEPDQVTGGGEREEGEFETREHEAGVPATIPEQTDGRIRRRQQNIRLVQTSDRIIERDNGEDNKACQTCLEWLARLLLVLLIILLGAYLLPFSRKPAPIIAGKGCDKDCVKYIDDVHRQFMANLTICDKLKDCDKVIRALVTDIVTNQLGDINKNKHEIIDAAAKQVEDVLAGSVSDLKSRIESLEAEQTTLHSHVKASQGTISEHTRLLLEVKGFADARTQKSLDATKQLRADVTGLESALTLLEARVSDLKPSSDGPDGEKPDSAVLTSLQSQITELKQLINNADDKVDPAIVQTVSEVQEKLNALSQTVIELSDKVSVSGNTITSLESELKEAKAKLKEMQTAPKPPTDTTPEDKPKGDDGDKGPAFDPAPLEAKIAALEEKLESEYYAKSALDDNLAALGNALKEGAADAEAKIQDLTDKLQQGDEQLSTVSQSVSELTEGHGKLASLTEAIQSAINDKDESDQKTLELVNKLQEDLEQITAESQQLQAIVNQLNDTINHMSENHPDEAELKAHYSQMLKDYITKEEAVTLMQQRLAKYAADKTMMIDWCSPGLGAKIVGHSDAHSRWFSLSGSPKLALDPDTSLGRCFPMKGESGFLTIKLGVRAPDSKIKISHVSVDHPLQAIVPDFGSTPKAFEVYGLRQAAPAITGLPAMIKGDLLARFEYTQINNQTLMMVPTKQTGHAYKSVVFKVTSNHGQPSYTCLYKVRVHGERV